MKVSLCFRGKQENDYLLMLCEVVVSSTPRQGHIQASRNNGRVTRFLVLFKDQQQTCCVLFSEFG